MNSSSSISLHSFASTGIILAIYGCNASINLVGMIVNFGLILITLRNRRFHSTCPLLIGFCSFCTLLLLTQHFIPFFVLLFSPSASILFLHCFLLHIFPVFGIFSAITLMGIIGLDRLFSVFFPIWYLQRNEGAGLASMVGLASIFPFAILLLMLKTALNRPNEPMLCTLNELLAENTSLVASLCLLVNFLSILCYLIVWTKLKLDLRKSGGNAESGHQQPAANFKSLSIIVAIQVGGWCISESAFAFIFFRLQNGSALQRYLAAGVNCFVCIAASTDPIVLFLCSEEYRKAFCQQFPWLSRIWAKVKQNRGDSVANLGGQMDGGRRQAWNPTTGSHSISRSSIAAAQNPPILNLN